MTTINSTPSSNVSNANLNSSSANMCTPDNPPAANQSATGVTATQDGYDGLRNASGITSTTTNALTVRNNALIGALRHTDDAAGAINGLKGYNNALGLVGATANTVNAALNSNQTTMAGQATNVTLTAGLSVASIGANPIVGAVDLATGGEVSTTLNSSVNATVGLAEAAITKDTSGIESIHQENLRGENGYVMREAAEAGDFWAEKGVSGGLREFTSELRDFIW